MISAWMQKALKHLTSDELQRLLDKCKTDYNSGIKIIEVHRDENNRPKITVQIESGERKLVVL